MTPQEEAELAQLEQARPAQVAMVQSIESELSQKRRYDPDGKMWDVARYQRWRTSATKARAHAVRELGAMNAQLKELREKKAAAGYRSSAKELISQAHALLCRLRYEDVDFDASEITIIEALGAYLK